VRTWSTISVLGRIYSVPSRLIGHEVQARVHPNVVEVRLPGVNKPAVTMPRLRGTQTHAIDYRHVIWSLVKTRRLRGVPLPRGPLPVARVPTGLRRTPRASR
jgi:hypothetical protein